MKAPRVRSHWEAAVAGDLLRYLAQRPVFTRGAEDLEPRASVERVTAIRQHLVGVADEVHRAPVGTELELHLRAMSGACRRFLDTVESLRWDTGGVSPADGPGRRAFFVALGELRGVFGVYVVAIIAAEEVVASGRAQFDIESTLASIVTSSDQ